MNFDDLLRQVKSFIGNPAPLMERQSYPPINRAALNKLLEDEYTYNDQNEVLQMGRQGMTANTPSEQAYRNSIFGKQVEALSNQYDNYAPVPDVVPRGAKEQVYEDGSSEYILPTRDLNAIKPRPGMKVKPKFY